MEFQPNYEIMIADESDVRRTVIAMQHLLNNFGGASGEYGVSQILGYSFINLEKYQLTPTETEIVESETDIIIQSIDIPSNEYEKGLYMYVWKDICPSEEELLPGVRLPEATFQRHTEYRFSLSNEAWVYEEFQIEPDDVSDESVWDTNPPELESILMRSKVRRRELDRVRRILKESKLTVAEIINLNQMLAEFNPANTIDVSNWG